MLHHVGAALSRLIKPIKLAESAASHLSTQKDGQHPPQQDQQNHDFQRSHPETVTPEKTEKVLPSTEVKGKQGFMPGLTTAFLNLIEKLDERRKSMKLWPGSKNYANGASRKKSALRKGIVLDHKA